MPARVVYLPAPEYSDGSSQYWPLKDERQTLVPKSTLYLEKIATMWMKEKGEAEPGVVYCFESLPQGYAVFEQRRITGPKHVDKRLFGFHKKYFDSPNRYFPHFLHVMNNKGSNEGCPCTVCATGKKQPGRLGPGINPRAATTPKRKADGPVDEEGNPDVYRRLIERLRTEKAIDEPVEEPGTMDWRATKKDLGKMQRACISQPSWIPRTGELVIFLPYLEENQEIGYEKEAGRFVIRDSTTGRVTGTPEWQAGVVTEVSAAQLTEADLKSAVNRDVGVNYSGFKIECMSDPNETEKSLSKQYKYVPLHLLRPLRYWKQLVSGIPDSQWHITIFNAITAMASFSLLDKYRFKGVWPQAAILSRGLYLGSELLFVGDVVSLFAVKEGASTSHTGDHPILHITSIELHFASLDQPSDRPLSSTVAVSGVAYTTNPKLVCAGGQLLNPASENLPKGISDYAAAGVPLYLIHPPGKKIRVPFHRIVGRCFEAVALQTWFPDLLSQQKSDDATRPHEFVTLGCDSISYARVFSQSDLTRLAGPNGVGNDGAEEGISLNMNKKWFWADTRVEQLDLLSVNGIDVGRADRTRNPKGWRKEIAKLLESRSPSQTPLLNPSSETKNEDQQQHLQQVNGSTFHSVQLDETGDVTMQSASPTRASPDRSMLLPPSSNGSGEKSSSAPPDGTKEVSSSTDPAFTSSSHLHKRALSATPGTSPHKLGDALKKRKVGVDEAMKPE